MINKTTFANSTMLAAIILLGAGCATMKNTSSELGRAQPTQIQSETITTNTPPAPTVITENPISPTKGGDKESGTKSPKVADQNFAAKFNELHKPVNTTDTTFTLDKVLATDSGDGVGPTHEVDVNQLTPEQQAAVERITQLDIKYIPVYRHVVDLLRNGNTVELTNLTHSCTINQYGKAAIEAVYQSISAPFFSDYDHVNENDGTISPLLGFCDPEGMMYGETMFTKSGGTKNFIVILANDHGQIKIASIEINKRVEDYHK